MAIILNNIDRYTENKDVNLFHPQDNNDLRVEMDWNGFILFLLQDYDKVYSILMIGQQR